MPGMETKKEREKKEKKKSQLPSNPSELSNTHRQKNKPLKPSLRIFLFEEHWSKKIILLLKDSLISIHCYNNGELRHGQGVFPQQIDSVNSLAVEIKTSQCN